MDLYKLVIGDYDEPICRLCPKNFERLSNCFLSYSNCIPRANVPSSPAETVSIHVHNSNNAKLCSEQEVHLELMASQWAGIIPTPQASDEEVEVPEPLQGQLKFC